MGNVSSRKESYKTQLAKLRELCRDAKETLFERVEIAVKVFRDEEFRADHSDLDDYELGELLRDDFLQEMVGTDFTYLVTMYERFPAKTDWAGRKFSHMLDIIKGEEETKRQKLRDEKGRIEQTRITKDQFREVENAKKEVEVRANYLTREVETQKSEVERLREENVKLKQELAEERGRRMELERLLDKQAA